MEKKENWFIRFAKWAAGFFEDQTDRASRKAAALYWFFILLTWEVRHPPKNLEDPGMYIFYATILSIFLTLGLITAEILARVFETWKTNQKPKEPPKPEVEK